MMIFFITVFIILGKYQILLNQRNIKEIKIIIILIFYLICLVLSFSTIFYDFDEILMSAWHHWSAYIGPAQLIKAGGRVFYDFPAQYGLGPTALIALSCHWDCWTGMYFIVGGMNFLYSIVIGSIVLHLLGKDCGLEKVIVALICVLVACFLYTAYPPSLIITSVAPSVGGLRFLPCTLILAYLIYISDKDWHWTNKFLGHILWSVGLLWSPESAYQVTFVWCTYYIWRNCFTNKNIINRYQLLLIAIKNIIYLIIFCVSFLFILVIIYHHFYSVYPSTFGVFAYVLNPPGSLPINFSGALQFFVAIFIVSYLWMFKLLYTNGDQIDLNCGIPVLLTLYATSSYYIGRSYENNLLNLMPFILIMLFLIYKSKDSIICNLIGKTGISCIVSLIFSFGWTPYWKAINFNFKILTTDLDMIKSKFTFQSDTNLKLSLNENSNFVSRSKYLDIQKASDYIWNNYNESMTLLSPPWVLISKNAYPWMSMHFPANFGFMPSEMKKIFLERSMCLFNLPGWVLINKDKTDESEKYAQEWLKDINNVYDQDVTLNFGTFAAIRYTPGKRKFNCD
jgi:hypothetical protein